jgi:hypothetical protein
MKMTTDELDEFLRGNPPAPNYVAVATVRKDGFPFVVPVGYLDEDGCIYRRGRLYLPQRENVSCMDAGKVRDGETQRPVTPEEARSHASRG